MSKETEIKKFDENEWKERLREKVRVQLMDSLPPEMLDEMVKVQFEVVKKQIVEMEVRAAIKIKVEEQVKEYLQHNQRYGSVDNISNTIMTHVRAAFPQILQDWVALMVQNVVNQMNQRSY
jgi:hypothetical protein